MKSKKQYAALALVVAVIVALLANDNQLSKPLVMALSIIGTVTVVGVIGFAFAYRMHKKKQDAKFAALERE